MSYHGCGVIRSFFQCHIPQHKVTLVRSHVFEANMVFVWLLNSNGSDVFLSLSATKKVRYFVVVFFQFPRDKKKERKNHSKIPTHEAFWLRACLHQDDIIFFGFGNPKLNLHLVDPML